MLLFVYGTLRSFNNSRMKGNSSILLGPAKTKEKFSLHVDGYIPFLHDDENEYEVIGELWEVKPSFLEELDEFEIEGQWYHRKPLQVICNDVEETAYAYFNNDVGIKLTHGDYEDFLRYDKK